MKVRDVFALTIAVILTAPLPFAVAYADGFQLKDLRQQVNLGEPRMSPDGKQVAVIVSRPDWKTDKRKSEIDLIDVANGHSRTLTYNREGLGSPRWSPDGRHIAAIRWTRGGTSALVVVDMPFGSYEASNEQAIANAQRFVNEAGCDAVKRSEGVGGWSEAGLALEPEGGRVAESGEAASILQAQGKRAHS